MTVRRRFFCFLCFFCTAFICCTVCSLERRSVSRVFSSSMRSLRPSVESIAAKEYALTVCARSRPQRRQRSSLVRLARPQTQSQTVSSSRA